MKRITFNLNDPSVEQWLEQQVAQGQQQTEVITVALRQAATLTQSNSVREQALQEEIERLHRLVERIVVTGRVQTILSEQGSEDAQQTTNDPWAW